MRVGFTVGKSDGFDGGINNMSPQKVIPWEKNPRRFYVDGMFNSDIAVIHEFHKQNPDIEIDLILPNEISKRRMQSNDINFILGQDLVDGFWNRRGYEKTKEIYESVNIFPLMNLQMFVVNKGKYYDYFKKKGIPVADTFTIYKQGTKHYTTPNGKKRATAEYIINKAQRKGWNKMISKVLMGAWGIGFKKWDIQKLKENPSEFKKFKKYLESRRTLKFPGIIFQREIENFLDNWEIRTYWFDNKFGTAVGTKANFELGDDDVATEKEIQKYLPHLKKLGKKVLSVIPKQKVKGKVVNPVMMRIDFGCCQPGMNAPKGYLLNEIENMGCNLFLGFSKYNVPKRFAQVLGERSRELYKLGWRRKYQNLPPKAIANRRDTSKSRTRARSRRAQSSRRAQRSRRRRRTRSRHAQRSRRKSY